MKFIGGILILVFLITGCEDTNVQLATEAGMDAVSAITLSDHDVRALAMAAVGDYDRKHSLSGTDTIYGKRLDRLSRERIRDHGIPYDIQIYLSPKVNAFAMANGAIRIYSGLMDRMTDMELLFVIGHEMGHVHENHLKKRLMVAYAASALRKGIASQENFAGAIAGSALGVLTQDLANAQFSQKEEQAADDFGLLFLKQIGIPDHIAVSAAGGALEKLAASSGTHSLWSSHPAPKQRAERIRQEESVKDLSGLKGLMEKGTQWFSLLLERVLGKLMIEKREN